MSSQYDQNVTSNMRQLTDNKTLIALAQIIHYSDILCTFSKLRIYYGKIFLKVFRILTKSNCTLFFKNQ